MTSFTVKGSVAYAFLSEDNLAKQFDPIGVYLVKLYPDAEGINTIEDAGCTHLINAPKDNDKGPYVNIKKPFMRPKYTPDGKRTGDMQQNTPPFIYNLPEGKLIGPESKVTVQFKTYKGRGNKTFMELEGVRVEEFVEYVPNTKEDLLKVVE